MRKGKHEPIISLKTYQQIQNRGAMGARIPTRTDLHKNFVLRCAVCCADCGVPHKSC
ncbi:MAG: hypothetical protein AAGK02_16150 [Pseudomonadota bacterium]